MHTPWFNHYQIFLFDFDGLLVDTEYMHYSAYKQTSQDLDLVYPFDYPQYCQLAHGGSSLMRNRWYELVPALKEKGPWESIYEAKRQNYLRAVSTQQIHLMPGAAAFLEELLSSGKKVAVVTHSGRALITAIRTNHPLLQRIPLWITREDYPNPKPAPDGYLQAIELIQSDPKEQIIGFEDSLRGLTSQIQTQKMTPVHISPETFAQLPNHIPYPIRSFKSFEELLGRDRLPEPNVYPSKEA
jgi:HAD superfamily hydrolase (TIGR01509 family)